MYCGPHGTVPCNGLERMHEKSSRPHSEPDAQARTGAEHTSVVPPWFTAPSRVQPRCCGRNLCLQPDAVTGASRCELSAPAPRPHSSETIFSFLFPALFHRPGFLVRINAKAYSSLHSHFCDIAFILPHLPIFVNPFNEVF